MKRRRRDALDARDRNRVAVGLVGHARAQHLVERSISLDVVVAADAGLVDAEVGAASMKPGYTLAPRTSTIFAPDGTDTLAPIAWILLPRMTIVPFSITGRSPVTIRAFVIAHAGPPAFSLTSTAGSRC